MLFLFCAEHGLLFNSTLNNCYHAQDYAHQWIPKLFTILTLREICTTVINIVTFTTILAILHFPSWFLFSLKFLNTDISKIAIYNTYHIEFLNDGTNTLIPNTTYNVLLQLYIQIYTCKKYLFFEPDKIVECY